MAEPLHHSVRDRLIELIVKTWSKTLYCRVSVNTAGEGDDREEWDGRSPDIIGWQAKGTHRTVEWIARVETEETFLAPDAGERWQRYAQLRLPLYLFVPKGYRSASQILASRVGLHVSGIYEYDLLGEELLLI
jgi:hypothetical protein